MKILLITPGIVKKYNDNFYAYESMVQKGNDILVITQQLNINKGADQNPEPDFEIIDGIEIQRLFKNLSEMKSLFSHNIKLKKIKSILDRFKPEVIFVEEISNMPLAVSINKIYKLPLVLRVEFAYDETKPYQTMGNKLSYFRNPIIGNWLSIKIGKCIWEWACKHSDAVISCYYKDSLRIISSKDNLKTYYVPWPSHSPIEINKNIKRGNYGVFIGSFDKHKNLYELIETIPLILEKSLIDKFYIVGGGEDIDIIHEIKNLYADKIIHLTSLTRVQCMKLIGNALFSYSPAVRGGWGFIGDSWAVGTPVIVTHNHYGFRDGVDSIVTNPVEIAERINQLRNIEYFDIISNGGFLKYTKEHTATSVGNKYLEICDLLI
jgi:glycosyltransferase involved in cell wall biosynthesis